MEVNGRKYDIGKIFDVVVAFNSESNYAKLLNIILTAMMEITDSDAGTLYMLENGRLNFRIIKNNTLNILNSAEDEIDLPPIVLDRENIENISAYSAIKNEIVNVDDVYASDRFNFNGPKKYDSITGYRTKSMLVFPLTASTDERNEVLGVIQLMNSIDPTTGEAIPYGNINEPPVIPALSKIAANTLSNLMYLREIKQLFHSFVEVMTKAIDGRSPYNNAHTQNVSTFCLEFARHLSEIFPKKHPFHFDEGRQERLTMAALLHDIGKIITPLQIMDKADRLGERFEPLRYKFEIKRCQLEIEYLSNRLDRAGYESGKSALSDALSLIERINTAGYLTHDDQAKVMSLTGIKYINLEGKSVPILEEPDIDALTIQKGTLTEGERYIMQEHVTITGKLLDKIAFWKYFKDVPDWARSHHEFLDGSGYPNHLKNGELAAEVCIITIMDIFDALTANDRPYKKGVPLDKAIEILASMAEEGKLHAELVSLFKESRIWEKCGLPYADY